MGLSFMLMIGVGWEFWDGVYGKRFLRPSKQGL